MLTIGNQGSTITEKVPGIKQMINTERFYAGMRKTENVKQTTRRSLWSNVDHCKASINLNKL